MTVYRIQIAKEKSIAKEPFMGITQRTFLIFLAIANHVPCRSQSSPPKEQGCLPFSVWSNGRVPQTKNKYNQGTKNTDQKLYSGYGG